MRVAAIVLVVLASLAGCKKPKQRAPAANRPAEPSLPAIGVDDCTRPAIEAKLVGAELTRFKETGCLPDSLSGCVRIVPWPCLE